MKNKYLALLANYNDSPEVRIIRLHGREDEHQVAASFGLDLDKCEWMVGEMDLSINI
jgi:hypothetical protein